MRNRVGKTHLLVDNALPQWNMMDIWIKKNHTHGDADGGLAYFLLRRLSQTDHRFK